jgi:hypothetical protein
MSRTYPVAATATVDQIIQLICNYAQQGQGIVIKNLVLNCHGSPGYLRMGQGIGWQDVESFTQIRGLVEKIWIHACRIAGRDQVFGERVGDHYCSSLARAARCYVVASTEIQASTRNHTYPYGQIDTFEGLALTWNPEGNVSSSRRFRSTYQRNPGDSNSWYQNR